MSIFDFKNNSSELDSMNHGVSRSGWEQCPPTREISGTSFANGAISFRFENSWGTRHWLPSRSFLRMRLRLTNAAGNPLNIANGIAPNLNLMSAMFQSAEYRMNDKTVCKVSDFLPQISTLDERLHKSESWLKGIGKSSNFWESSFKLRQVDCCSDGITANKTVRYSTPANGGMSGATIAIAAATNVATFSVDLALAGNPMQVGDTIEVLGKRATVITVTNGTTVTLSPLALAGDLAATANYARIRNEYGAESKARNVSTFELIWQPPLSIWKIPTVVPAGVRHELVLTPYPSQAYVKGVIESVGADKVLGVDYAISVIDMYLENFMVEGSRIDNATVFLDLNEISCSTETVGVSNSYIQKNFTVSPSTTALVLAYQDARCLSDTRFSPCRFKTYNPAGDTALELKLDRLEVQYGGQSQPSPQAQISYTQGVDLYTERYVSSMLASGMYFETGGAPDFQTFTELGNYFYFSFNRDGSDRSQQVTVNASFGNVVNGADLANTRILLFSISKKVARLQLENGRLTDVQVVDA